ncbi:unnamed protein product [Brachionus calyciflorus]|uniref:WSC domain-containing protein n=1 Tax=Brachionus calyciflorus TaxID=104777 RepID=A0A814B1E4_9BILA|nr:unnamed protein product [Brachionus calyciflorus]
MIGNELVATIYEDAEYIGCFRDTLDTLDFDISEKIFDEFDANKCFENCRIKGFLFAGTRSINEVSYLCLCGNKYGAFKKFGNEYCECTCKGNPTTFCGCSFSTYYNRVYRILNRTKSYELLANYIGCFSNLLPSLLISSKSWPSNRLMSKKCSENYNSNYSASFDGSYFMCPNVINLNHTINEANCNKLCSKNSNETCGGSKALTIYSISKNSFSVKCPDLVYVNQSFTCDLRLELINKSFNFSIDFDDGQSIYLSGNKSFANIYKKYLLPRFYTMNIKLLGSNVNLNPQVLVKDELSNNLNGTIILKDDLIEHPQFGEYIGCFVHYVFLNFRKELLITKISTRIPRVCIAECKNQNYTYALIGEDFCICSMKYGSLNAYSDDSCECLCYHSPDSFCGCNAYFLVYKIKNRQKFEITQGIYKGCFDSVHKYNGTYILNYNNNEICLKKCLQLGYKYFSTHNKYYCNCEQNLINETDRIGEDNCQLECPSNQNQTCGGYFGPKSFYEIKSIILSFSALPSHIRKINETVIFKIEINSNNLIYLMTINFGDGTQKNFSMKDFFIMEKTYNQKGLYKIEVYFLNSEFSVELDILSNQKIIGDFILKI